MAFGKTSRKMKAHARKSKGLYNESNIAKKQREQERPPRVRRITKNGDIVSLKTQTLRDDDH